MLLPARTARLCGWIGLLAALAAAACDLLLQYTGDARRLGSAWYAYLLDVGDGRLLVGHAIGVVAVQLEVLGFVYVASRLLPRRRAAASLVALGSLGFLVGGAFHAVFAPVGLMLRRGRALGLDTATLGQLGSAARPAHETLGWVVLPAIALASLVFLVAVGRGGTALPRAAAAATPLLIMVVLVLLIRVVPASAPVLLPAGINLAHAAWLAACLALDRRDDVA